MERIKREEEAKIKEEVDWFNELYSVKFTCILPVQNAKDENNENDFDRISTSINLQWSTPFQLKTQLSKQSRLSLQNQLTQQSFNEKLVSIEVSNLWFQNKWLSTENTIFEEINKSKNPKKLLILIHVAKQWFL
mgnify:CR=1 FL=1